MNSLLIYNQNRNKLRILIRNKIDEELKNIENFRIVSNIINSEIIVQIEKTNENTAQDSMKLVEYIEEKLKIITNGISRNNFSEQMFYNIIIYYDTETYDDIEICNLFKQVIL